jgi:phosphoribosylformimino-5-aminoimidazole carboxamide ribonucleotide (ProFAR) isomerase
MSVLQATRHPVTYSGGIRSAADVAAVGHAGAAAVILGRSLLEGSITLAEVL